jgi:hypothetical protein
MNKILVTFFCLFLLVSCNTNSAKVNPPDSSRDVILKEYVSQADSISYFDTIDANYRFLKAYLNDDTSYLAKSTRDLKDFILAIPRELRVDSCAKTPSLINPSSEEAYRFIYQEVYSSYTANITVSHSNAGTQMHVLVYKPKASNEPCQVIKEYNKEITSEQWDSIVQSLQYADFWGLRGENGQSGIDGTSLYIDGYKRGQNGFEDKLHRVYRWFLGNLGKSAIGDSYKLVYHISGFTQFKIE